MNTFRANYRWTGLGCAALTWSFLIGCQTSGETDKTSIVQKENRELKAAQERDQQEISRLSSEVADLEQQVNSLRRLGPDRLAKLYAPVKIVLERLTGGADYDGLPGDDGVTVYIQPIDQQGHVVKTAGEIRIQLLDLANPDGQHLLGEYVLDVDHAAEAWHGRFMTQHFTVQCPWRVGPPAHREITLRVRFLDYLTGRELAATTVCTVTPPPKPKGGGE